VSDPLDDLTAVLSVQAAELRALVPLLDEQQNALTRADSARVAEGMFRQAPILRRLLRLDQRRLTVVATLAARFGLEPARLSLSALLARAPAVPAALAAVQEELRRLLEAVDVRNRRNAFLLGRAVASLEALTRAVIAPGAEPAPVYVATGRPARRRAGPRLVDRSA
jgi:flagellar biosynthesis/type III secretory pathway chaperone